MRQDICFKIHFNLKRIFFFFTLLILGLLFWAPSNVFSQEIGFKYIKNFTPKDYNESPKNYCIVQDKRGVIYAANQGGLLEYDGVSWRLIPIPNITVFSMAIADDGTIYVGGYREMGFLAPDSKGTLRYESLRNHLKDDQKNLSYVWKTYSTKEGVHFQTREYLFRWDGKRKQIKVLTKDVNALFTCREELYIRREGTGLLQMKDDSFELVPGGEAFAEKKIFMMVEYDSQQLLIGTNKNGLYLYDGMKATPFETDVDDYLKENKLYHGIRLESGDFALATFGGGLAIIDSGGRLKYLFDEDAGLQDNSVKHVFQDNQGNLWLSLDSGISKIEYKSPFSIFDKRSKLPGSVLAVTWHGSPNSGLYTFRLQAKNVYGHLSREDIFQFKVFIPWYRTWWAYLFYAIVLLLLMFIIISWQRYKVLEQEKQKLEQTVKERTKELEEQSEKLKEMDKVKSRFFANISREFRTPLTLIMGPLEQMLAKSRDKEQQKSLNLMLRNSPRLLSLINQLLELSKFDSGKIKLNACRSNIVPFLKGIVSTFEPVVNKNELDLTFHTEEENITLYFDSKNLEEAAFNLLSNAVKFTPPGGKITVNIAKNDTKEESFPSGSLDISVSDTGPGIPRDQLSHIFDRFYQSESTYENNHKGSGIGLAIAKEVVELHHGKINVHSLEGKGTEFIIRLPLGKEHLKSDEIVEPCIPADVKGVPGVPVDDKGVPVDDKSLPEDVDLSEDDSNEINTTKAEEDIDPFKQEKDIILVVEDSADVRDYIRVSLEPVYTVVEAKDGREGIQKAQEITPDLIISDIMMPEADGYELCRVLKNDINTNHVPIILLTAKASEQSIIQGLETGADDYITKPFNTKILCARIKNLIGLRRHMQQTLNREMTMQPVKMAVSRVDKEFINKLKEVLKGNISDPDLNVDQLCKKMNMSQSNLYRKIRALSGGSPTEFIRSYRLKKGAELLKNNYGTIMEVAFEVGFSTANYFSKCFKKKFHQLPSTFKESEG
ncbi:MAG: response regulator [Candidatus Aminicenantes bacterium]|nr:response regulator [Candidatus Aminicenantes bacterium]NIM82144.1 response regulator [Candidatus Aminicenantes bacterium]NIN21545.1 response regulator [Candidatus Aminicenantes bacterium]NIN45354.1 response regulator [Candidatus Aminicenantes bacterium]NIN88175.1 response regulator [Candidatus Aminicenantes bacterium]